MNRLRADPARTRRALLMLLLVGLGALGCALVGLPPGLALVPTLLLAVRYPTAGLGFALVVLTVPLGLWLSGIEALVGAAFGGRDYVLSLAGTVVVGLLAVAAVLRRGGDLPFRWVWVGTGGLVATLLWGAIGVWRHGAVQTLTGLRILLVPVAVIIAVAALPPAAVRRLITLLSWLVVANAVAALAEVAAGPARLVRIGFSPDWNVRHIEGVFRVPGLTEFNAELGMLAGAYLLGYAASWLTPGARPRLPSWHAGAAGALVCLLLSTSRSGLLLVLAGGLGAVLLRRSGSRARRRVLLGLGGVLAGVVGAAFAVLGAAGAASLLDRFRVWGELIATMPPLGLGIGGAGAATFSRVAGGEQLFVDNYFLNVGLQFGPLVMALMVVAVGLTLARLSRDSVSSPRYVMPIAVLAGLAGASLTIDSWEFPAAVSTLTLFCAYGLRPPETSQTWPPAPPVPAPPVPAPVPPAPPVPAPPAAERTPG